MHADMPLRTCVHAATLRRTRRHSHMHARLHTHAQQGIVRAHHPRRVHTHELCTGLRTFCVFARVCGVCVGVTVGVHACVYGRPYVCMGVHVCMCVHAREQGTAHVHAYVVRAPAQALYAGA